MALKVGEEYVCSYCGKKHPDPYRADKCRDSHNLIYVQLSANDLNRLVSFLHLKDESLLTSSLVERLQAYLRQAVRNEP